LHGQEAHNPNEKKCDLPKDFDTKAKALSSNSQSLHPNH
jgi:hypothetical protein